MKRECAVKLNACPGVDSPITNRSSEAPDPLLFAAWGWTNYNPYAPIPLGGGQYVSVDCNQITYSAVSQEMANLLALLASSVCAPPVAPEIPGVPPMPSPMPNVPVFSWTPPSWNPEYTVEPFYNGEQTASATCPDGSVFSATFPAGSIVAYLDPAVGPYWVEYINAWLYSALLQQVIDQMVCLSLENIENRNYPAIEPPWWPELYPWPPGETRPEGYPPESPWPPENPNNLPPALRPSGTPKISSYPGYSCIGAEVSTGLATYSVSGSKEYVFSISAGELPNGIILVQTGPRSAMLVGSTYVAGSWSWTVKAASTDGFTSVSTIDTMYVFGFTNCAEDLPKATIGEEFEYQLTAGGGNPPYKFSIESGQLPEGFHLNETSGMIYSDGPVTAEAGTHNITFAVTDSGGSGTVPAWQMKCTCNTHLIIPAQELIWDWIVTSQSLEGGHCNESSAYYSDNVFYLDLVGCSSSVACYGLTAHHNYTGPGASCELRLNITNLVSVYFGIYIEQDGVRILSVPCQTVLPPIINPYELSTGVNVIPFNLSAGTNSLIQIVFGHHEALPAALGCVSWGPWIGRLTMTMAVYTV